MTQPEEPPEFMFQGACRNADPELFFAASGPAIQEARRVCWSCPVREECLEWSLETGQWWGVWGGVGHRERRRVMRARVAV